MGKISHLKFTANHPPKYRNGKYDVWLAIDGNAVVWIEYALENGKIYLWSIETRPEYRNQGFAHQSLDILKSYYEVSCIYHDGEYTPEGFNFLATKLAIPEGLPRQTKATFRSMDFVHDWDNHLL